MLFKHLYIRFRSIKKNYIQKIYQLEKSKEPCMYILPFLDIGIMFSYENETKECWVAKFFEQWSKKAKKSDAEFA